MITTISDFFNIDYGQKEYHNKENLDIGENLLISSKGVDNGCYGFFDIENKFETAIITVPSTGSIGHAFVQLNKCSVDDNCLVLIPKRKMAVEDLYKVAFQIRNVKWKYKYGRQITPKRMGDQEIILGDININYDQLVTKLLPKEITKKKNKSMVQTKSFKLKKLFKVVRGKGSYLEKMGEGDIPVISTKTANCGVNGFYDIEPSFKKNHITIGRIYCNANVQLYDFSTVPDDMFVLKPLIDIDKEFLFYVAVFIRLEKWKFNFYRKVRKEKIENINIILPMKDDEIDFGYIRDFVKNNYGYNELN